MLIYGLVELNNCSLAAIRKYLTVTLQASDYIKLAFFVNDDILTYTHFRAST